MKSFTFISHSSAQFTKLLLYWICSLEFINAIWICRWPTTEPWEELERLSQMRRVIHWEQIRGDKRCDGMNFLTSFLPVSKSFLAETDGQFAPVLVAGPEQTPQAYRPVIYSMLPQCTGNPVERGVGELGRCRSAAKRRDGSRSKPSPRYTSE